MRRLLRHSTNVDSGSTTVRPALPGLVPVVPTVRTSSTRAAIRLVSCGLLALTVACSDHASEDHARGDHAHDAAHVKDAGAKDAHGPGHAAGAASGHEHDGEIVLSSEAIARHGVTEAVAESRVLQATLSAPAQVAFNRDRMAHVGTPVAGRVVALLAELGQEVSVGDPLVRIESAELAEAQGQYLLRRAERRALEPGAEFARLAYERGRELAEANQGVSLSEVQKREGDWRVAQGNLDAARTAESVAENRLVVLGLAREDVAELATKEHGSASLELRAPLAGRVVARDLTLGERVDPTRDALVIVADMDHLWVLADVPASRLAEVAPGARARVWAGTDVEHGCEGRVTYVSPTVDPRTRSVVARIVASDRHPELRPGVFVRVEIDVTGSATGAAPTVVIPETAIARIEGQTCVFVPVPGEPGTFRKRAVTVGAPTQGHVSVTSGLAVGERYVAQGAFVLKAEAGKSEASHAH